ncbi:MAG: DUF2179 domain-containing protein [Bacilli bacterium]|nr:DUF2179 domain-containing protein [Bacilli bacterium]
MLFILILLLKTIEAFTSTISTILLIDEKRIMSSILSFVQIIIWFLIIKLALDDKNEILIAISYAAGYSIGTYLASLLTTKLSKKKLLVQIITNKNEVFDILKEHRYSGSIINAHGLYGTNIYIVYSFINNKRKNELISLINSVDINAFISINQSKELINGYFTHSNEH